MLNISPKTTKLIFIGTIFLSAGLLFFVQPLFAKLVLPYVGGSSSVWTTAMLFFQTILLLGYIYTHISAKYLSVFWQVGVHLGLWALALFFIPLTARLDFITDPTQIGTWQTLLIFATGVGIPFAVLSANAPLIQKWYSKSGGPNAKDPYFLYSASNIGSLAALLAFPFIVEPYLGVKNIGVLWAGGFVLLGGALLLSGLITHRYSKSHSAPNDASAEQTPITADTTSAPSGLKKLYWLLLAAIPSSLMLAVTSKISADLGSFPLVWIIPLSLYLLTFIVAFSGRQVFSPKGQQFLVVGCIIFQLFTQIIYGNLAVTWANFAQILVTFFILALVSHKRLYEARPSETHLTQFYIYMSLGGALGGFFNSIIATHMFNDLYEGPLIIAAACILIWTGQKLPKSDNIIMAVVVGALGFAVIGVANQLGAADMPRLVMILVLLVGFSLVYFYRSKEWESMAALATFVLFNGISTQSSYIYQDRSLFGVHRISEGEDIRVYFNGTTIHGAQLISQDGQRPTPLTYYHPNGPMGQIVGSADTQDTIGIVGLGVGSLSCYRKPGQTWHLYEIDPAVDKVARNPELFSFLPECAPDIATHLGDARLVLSQQDVKFDILVIDAFSSDAVPVHLLTLEAMDMYKNRLKPDGILLVHISNRYFNLARPLGRIAEKLDIKAYGKLHISKDSDSKVDVTSRVVVMGRGEKYDNLISQGDWHKLTTTYKHLWTDDYTNLLSILN